MDKRELKKYGNEPITLIRNLHNTNDYNRDFDKKIINNLYTDKECQDVLELSIKNEVPILKKNRNKWIIKDKRKLLKEIDGVRKKIVRELKENLSSYSKNKEDIVLVKDKNEKLIKNLESVENLKKNLENDNLYTKLKSLKEENIENDIFNFKPKIVDLKEKPKKYIEVYSNYNDANKFKK